VFSCLTSPPAQCAIPVLSMFPLIPVAINHLVTGCKGHRQQSHDAIKYDSNNILKILWSRISHLRPDISAHRIFWELQSKSYSLTKIRLCELKIWKWKKYKSNPVPIQIRNSRSFLRKLLEFLVVLCTPTSSNDYPVLLWIRSLIPLVDESIDIIMFDRTLIFMTHPFRRVW
jgi:hypothetical protein